MEIEVITNFVNTTPLWILVVLVVIIVVGVVALVS